MKTTCKHMLWIESHIPFPTSWIDIPYWIFSTKFRNLLVHTTKIAGIYIDNFGFAFKKTWLTPRTAMGLFCKIQLKNTSVPILLWKAQTRQFTAEQM